MNRAQKAALGGAHGRIEKILDRLHDRAARGARAKPTVAELNATLEDLKFARDEIIKAVAIGQPPATVAAQSSGWGIVVFENEHGDPNDVAFTKGPFDLYEDAIAWASDAKECADGRWKICAMEKA